MDSTSVGGAGPTPAPIAARGKVRFFRHRLAVRVMHWTNLVCMTVMLMSGLCILNAHPALYWGQSSSFDKPWASITAEKVQGGVVGVTRIAGHEFNTSGVLGVSKTEGEWTIRAFPSWATFPAAQALAHARDWHFRVAWLFVINGLAYVLYALLSGHFRRDLLPTKPELKAIGRSIKDHLLFRHPTGEAAKRYNVLQNLAYLVVIFGLLPLVIVTGMAMSPRLDSAIPGWVDIFGGRQSARTIHFLAVFSIFAFVLVHVFEVLVNGAWNQLRSMITGWYTLPADKG